MLTELDNELRPLFEQPEICKNCIGHGSCCRRHACNCHPLDFDNDVGKMEEALLTGKYAIDFTRKTALSFVRKCGYLTLDVKLILHNNEEVLFIRPRNYNRPIVDIIHERDDIYEGPCVLWSYEKGCELPYEQRPMFGRHMIASPIPRTCVSYYDMMEEDGQTKKLINDWKPYTKDLFKLAQKFFDENWHWYKQLNINLKEEDIG